MRYRWLRENCPWLIIPVGFFLIVFGLFCVIRKASCKTEIEAVLLRKERCYARGYYYCATFKFEYEGREFQTDVNLGKNDRIAKFYKPKAKYKIYINPKNPKIAYIDDKVDTELLFLVFLGVIGIVVYLLK